jgi:hypothetical protein
VAASTGRGESPSFEAEPTIVIISAAIIALTSKTTFLIAHPF